MAKRAPAGQKLPATTPKPCNDCPWRRVAVEGWLGPHAAIEWIQIAHSETAVACHKTIRSNRTDEDGYASWDDPDIRQCRGLAIFREHVCKSPKDEQIETGPRDPEHVFVSNAEFIQHHTGKPMTDEEVVQAIFRRQLGED